MTSDCLDVSVTLDNYKFNNKINRFDEKIKMDQQGYDWHEFRRNGIGSSDAPIVAGISPYSTRYKLWLTKTGRHKEEISHFGTERGHRLEPKARAWYEFKMGRKMDASTVINPEVPWLRASLDGMSEDGRKLLEIKCPGKKDHDIALAGGVPDKYYVQVQHQLLVTGAESVDYLSFDGETGVIVTVYPHEEYIAKLFEMEVLFWYNHILADRAPDLVKRDYKMIRGDKELRLLLETGQHDKVVSKYKGQMIRCGPFFIDSKGVRKVL